MKVGIVGAGSMGNTHAAAWMQTGAQLTGVAAATRLEAQPLADKFPVKIYDDFASLLQEVDVVDICTPTHLHYPMVLQAARAGRQVICEKPLALNVAQGQEMMQVCRAQGVRLLVAHVVRFFPEYALARQAVLDGQIGKPGLVRLTRGSYRPKRATGDWFFDESKSGGLLMDLMIHDYDYARWIAGDVESVYARKITAAPAGGVDYGLVILRHTSGALSHVAGAWAYPPPVFRTRFEIAGDAGLIEFDSDDTAPIKNLILKGGPDGAPEVALPGSPVSESPYTTQIKEFYRALEYNEPVRVSAADGLAAVQIAEAAIESARSGLPVKLAALAEVGL